MAAHTPGPWVWAEDALYPAEQWRVYTEWRNSTDANTDWAEMPDYPAPIIETDSGYYGPRGADIPLIAAAPDLLAVGKAVLAFLDTIVWNDYLSETDAANLEYALDAAIAKAEGR